MLDQLIRENDLVRIRIGPDDRAGGYDPCPDGTEATVTGFEETLVPRLRHWGQKPGVYRNRAQARLRFADGAEQVIASRCLSLADRGEEARRQETLLGPDAEKATRQPDFLRDLPDTPFWEGDYVRFLHPRMRNAFPYLKPPGRPYGCAQVSLINYGWHGDPASPTGKSDMYSISAGLQGGASVIVAERSLGLVERGPVWKHFHGERIRFADLREEAEFYALLGLVTEVANPRSGIYDWTFKGLLGAIREGLVDGLMGGFRLDPSGPAKGEHLTALRYHDRDLGRRVAQAMLRAHAKP